MALPAKRIPESVAHLDIEIVAAALIRNDANVRNAARALDVPSGDLRKLVLADQRLADAALEAVELRLDDAEANLCEALHSEDARRRDTVSMFMLRNVQRAAKRGYAVAASAASLEVGLGDPEPRRIIVRWRSPGESDDDKSDDDNGGWKPPVYDAGRREDHIERAGDIEGELVGPSVLLEHAAAEPEPEPAEESAVVEPGAAAAEPGSAVIDAAEPESAAARCERERVAAWVRARLMAYPVDRCCHCRLPFVAGQQWREAANDAVRVRFHAACYAEWRAGREAAARAALGLEG
jgi:hypothetical protein